MSLVMYSMRCLTTDGTLALKLQKLFAFLELDCQLMIWKKKLSCLGGPVGAEMYFTIYLYIDPRLDWTKVLKSLETSTFWRSLRLWDSLWGHYSRWIEIDLIVGKGCDIWTCMFLVHWFMPITFRLCREHLGWYWEHLDWCSALTSWLM